MPYRVSIFGGGTDFKDFYSDRGTTIVSFSIDKYCYLSLKRLLPYFNTKYRISWSYIEEVSKIEDIKHPSVRACLTEYSLEDGFEIHTVGDLPARSGLGSSSSFTAAMLAALTLYKGIKIDAVDIARQTIQIEQDVLQETVGIQDQIQVCHGGFNVTRIFPDSSYSIVSLNNTSSLVREINASLVLVYSGIVRNSSVIQELTLSATDPNIRHKNLSSIRSCAESFAERLLNHSVSFEEFSVLLNESWSYKASIMPHTQERSALLSIYDEALNAGAACGKLLGAGGGGFFAFFVPPENQIEFAKRMSAYILIRAKVSYTGVERVI